MRTRTRWRASSALWTMPFAMALTLFYYASTETYGNDYGYAPTLVVRPLNAAYALSYATVSALGAWESGRLRRGGIWALAPARSRFRVAADALLPVVALGWLMLLVPAGLSLAQGGAWPTPDSLPPLLLGLTLCCAHAVIGFAAGLRVPPVIAAPVMAVAVWLTVATSGTGESSGRRHISGDFGTTPQFGEGATLESVVAPLLPTASLAVAVALLWVRVSRLPVRLVAAVALVAACTLTAQSMTRDWGYRAPMRHSLVAMRCAGTAPEVCMPEATVRDIEAVRAEVTAAVEDLAEIGLAPPPRLVTDSTSEGFAHLPSTADTWHMGLTGAERRGDVRYVVMWDAMDLPCRTGRAGDTRPAVLWLLTRMGIAEGYPESAEHVPETWRSVEEVRAMAEEALTLPPDEQLAWYHAQLDEACRTGP
ncbi:hypothetical protein [Streptomyces sp. NPDC049881]|uniref:DUF7224 domain-containing protein n=1 Tax=Streptomyces sp. NPDC049881 TaxID=3155778 RepID=UPI00341D7348